MTKGQKILTLIGVGVGCYILYRQSKKNVIAPVSNGVDTSVPPNPTTNDGSQFIGEPLSTTVGVVSPKDVTWSDFGMLIGGNETVLNAMTTQQLVDQNQRANNFLISIGWDGVYNYYRAFLPNELLNNEISFALNINGGFSLNETPSPFAPSVATYTPAPAPSICTTTGAVTTGTQPLNVTTVPAVLANVAAVTSSPTPATPAVPVPAASNTVCFSGTRNNRHVALNNNKRK